MKRNKALITILSIVVVALLGFVGYAGYKLLIAEPPTKESDTETSNIESSDETDSSIGEETETPTEEESPSETEEPEEVSLIPEGWLEQTSETYGYSIGIPETWYFRFFGGTQSIGLDPNPIPEASEYAGIITFTADSGSLAEIVSRYTGGLIGLSHTTKTVNNTEWVQYNGMTSSDDIFYPDYKVLHSFYYTEGMTYKFSMMGSEETFNTNLERYNEIFETISFTD